MGCSEASETNHGSSKEQFFDISDQTNSLFLNGLSGVSTAIRRGQVFSGPGAAELSEGGVWGVFFLGFA